MSSKRQGFVFETTASSGTTYRSARWQPSAISTTPYPRELRLACNPCMNCSTIGALCLHIHASRQLRTTCHAGECRSSVSRQAPTKRCPRCTSSSCRPVGYSRWRSESQKSPWFERETIWLESGRGLGENRTTLDKSGESRVAQRCADSALLCGRSPSPCGFIWACRGGDWHFRLKSRGGALKGAHLLATCYSLPRRIAAITRGLRRPCMTATTQRGFSSGA